MNVKLQQNEHCNLTTVIVDMQLQIYHHFYNKFYKNLCDYSNHVNIVQSDAQVFS